MSDPRSMGPSGLTVLVSSDRRRGAEVFGEALTAGLRRRGWDVDFVALAKAPGGPKVAAAPLGDLSPDALGRLDPSVLAALRRRVGQHRPAVVLANGSSTLQYAVAALRLGIRRPRLVYVSIGDPAWWVRSARHRMVRSLILRGADRVFSVSATTGLHLVDEFGLSPGKLRIAPTGVPARFFAATRSDRTDGPLRVVFVGNLSTEKDPVAALDVVTGLGAKAELRYVGDGPLRERLESEIVTRGLGGSVEIAGSVPDVIPHLEWADVLLLTSRTEGLPAAPLEAGAAGIPSVVFAVGGAAETVLDGVTGRVVPAGDATAATAALAAMAADRDGLRAMGEAARTMVGERFTLEAAVDRYHDLLCDELGL